MLLKIGDKYLNTEVVTGYELDTDDPGKRLLHIGLVSGGKFVFADPAEIDALLRWLDAQAMDIMATPSDGLLPIGTQVEVTSSRAVLSDSNAVIVAIDYKDKALPYLVFSPDDNDSEWLGRRDFKVIVPAAPQPAPVETPRKFSPGDKARVLPEHRSNYNEVITVEGYTPEGYVYSHGGLCSYDEYELEMVQLAHVAALVNDDPRNLKFDIGDTVILKDGTDREAVIESFRYSPVSGIPQYLTSADPLQYFYAGDLERNAD